MVCALGYDLHHPTGQPSSTNAFLTTQQFCVSHNQFCDETSTCGCYIDSAEDCREAVTQLPLVRNGSFAVLSLSGEMARLAPQGCLLDSEMRAFFNAGGTRSSKYDALMSVCKAQAKEGGYSTPL